MKKLIFISIMCMFVSNPALADNAGDTVYYHTSSDLWIIPNVTNTSGSSFVGDVLIGSFGTTSSMTDIAFNADNSTLYGVSFTNVYQINTATGAATNIAAGPSGALNALANFGQDMFYMAGGSNFYTYDVSTLTSTFIGQYTDASGVIYSSAGDIWVTAAGTVYATMNSSSGWVATVNPSNAVVTLVAPIPGSGPTDMFGLTQNANGDLLVYRANTDVLKLVGSSLVDTGIDTQAGTWGATAAPPVSVEIDIKGGSCPNPFNYKSKGSVPVAIVGSDDYEVTAINPASIMLTTESGDTIFAIPDNWIFEDSTQPGDYDSEDCYDCFEGEPVDTDGDGIPDTVDGKLDLVVKFSTQELAGILSGLLKDDCVELMLTGETIDGIPIEGRDSMLITKDIP